MKIKILFNKQLNNFNYFLQSPKNRLSQYFQDNKSWIPNKIKKLKNKNNCKNYKVLYLKKNLIQTKIKIIIKKFKKKKTNPKPNPDLQLMNKIWIQTLYFKKSLDIAKINNIMTKFKIC